MKTIATQISSLLFILLGFTPLLFILSFNIQQHSIHLRMKERLEESILHTVTLADVQVHWVKKDKEIWVDGKMFDIRTARHHNGYTIFTGLYDEEETALKKQLKDSWENDGAKDSKLLVQLFNCLQQLFLDRGSSLQLPTSAQTAYRKSHTPELSTQFRVIPTPPPQV